MKIYYRHEEPYYRISACNYSDMPIIPMVGDIIWLNGSKYKVVRREFDLDVSDNESYVEVYVEDI